MASMRTSHLPASLTSQDAGGQGEELLAGGGCRGRIDLVGQQHQQQQKDARMLHIPGRLKDQGSAFLPPFLHGSLGAALYIPQGSAGAPFPMARLEGHPRLRFIRGSGWEPGAAAAPTLR